MFTNEDQVNFGAATTQDMKMKTESTQNREVSVEVTIKVI